MTALLAGYIGGSRVDLAQVRRSKGRISLVNQETFPTSDFSNFDSILKLYLKKRKTGVAAACFGVAGPVIRDQVSATNLSWHIAGEDIQKKFSFPRVKLINDIVATAHGLSELDSEKFFTINEGHKNGHGNIALIAAGSGLGEALIYNDGRKFHPYASEGGHADFAPHNALEGELWAYIFSRQGRVEVEDVVSLGGIERIYQFLVDTQRGVKADWFDNSEDRASLIVENALSGNDENSIATMDVFIDCYASEAANLVLKGMALGGVYIGGLIAPRIITLLESGRFMERFVKQGKMTQMLTDMPVGVIIEEKTALLGAADVATGL